jgi:hypothetical protein
MPDYSKGQIYTIRFYENDKLIYIGSTIQPLAVRFSGHKKNITCSLFQYIKEHYEGDFKCCYIELLEYFKCDNKQELNKKEGEIIREYKAKNDYNIINKRIEGRTKKQYNQENTDKIKQYRQDNIDKIKEREKQYRQDNKDKLKEINKQYRQENADKIKERKKQYRQDNADKIKQYRQDNTDKIKEREKQYRQENTDKIKQYQQKNADKRKEYLKQYRQENADKIKEQIKKYNKEYYQKSKILKTKTEED